jgi:hypothetical protein
MTLNIGDIITFAHYDTIHGRFEVQGKVTHPIYGGNGDLERVYVTVGGRAGVVEPCQILESASSNTPQHRSSSTSR